jgi:hypothetical protein
MIYSVFRMCVCAPVDPTTTVHFLLTAWSVVCVSAGVPFMVRTINYGKHGWGFVVSVRWILCGML